jgi:activator of HSP90 ATPase
MPREIKQTVTFDATPKQIYGALIDPEQHSAFTGAKARITPEVGSRFSAHDGYITGINVELTPGKRIVQAWRGKTWPKGAYSIVCFELEAAGRRRTRLIFTQYGVPDKYHERMSEGWKSHYWAPLKKWLLDRKARRRKSSRARRSAPVKQAVASAEASVQQVHSPRRRAPRANASPAATP